MNDAPCPPVDVAAVLATMRRAVQLLDLDGSKGVAANLHEVRAAVEQMAAELAEAREENERLRTRLGKLPVKWNGITRNRDIERNARVFIDGYDAALNYCSEELASALAQIGTA